MYIIKSDRDPVIIENNADVESRCRFRMMGCTFERALNWLDPQFWQQHHTHVTNNLLKEIKVVVQHPNGRYDVLRIDSHGSRCVPTDKGTVTVALLDDEEDDIVEQRNVPSDISVMVTDETKMGKPQLVRTKYDHIWKVDPQEYQY